MKYLSIILYLAVTINGDWNLCFFLPTFATVYRKGLITDAVNVLSAVLLVVWYVLSVSGLDVHDDREHGHTYVVCSASGCDCEHIHPEAHCHDHAADADGECLADEECCSDDFEAVLSLSESQDGGSPDLTAPVQALPGILPPGPLPATESPARAIRRHAPPPDPLVYFLKLSVLRA